MKTRPAAMTHILYVPDLVGPMILISPFGWGKETLRMNDCSCQLSLADAGDVIRGLYHRDGNPR